MTVRTSCRSSSRPSRDGWHSPGSCSRACASWAALTEACTNSVKHAYGEDGSGWIEVRYELRPDELSVEVADGGQGSFDRVPELPARPDGELRENEMGLAIIHALVDDVEIGAGPEGQGTRLRLRKDLAPTPAGRA